MKAALQRLPKGSDALELAYNGAVERIDSQKPGLRDLANQVLSWITYARRPLRTAELQHALAIEIGESYLDEENFSDIEEMINVCAGLVTVDENSKAIRFIHYTTQEYFESIQKFRFPGADDCVALSCISYLTRDDLDVESFGRFPVDYKCELVEYAAEHWGHHARMASTEVVTPPAVRLLQMDKRLRSFLELNGNIFSTHLQSSPSIALWVAAFFGLEDAAWQLLSNGADANCKMNGETALYAASYGGFAGVVRILLDAGSDVELTGGSRGTALAAAAYHGHNDVIRLLIPKSFPWWRHGNALKEATDGGHNDTVKLLLEEGADIKSPYGTGDNLARAILSGSESVVRIFFDRGATIDPCGAMAIAAGEGHSGVVQLLIEKQSKDDDQEARLWIEQGILAASAGDHTEMVAKLISLRSDMNINLMPALMTTCQYGSVQTFKFFLRQDPSLFRTKWQDLLSTAMISEQEVIIQSLLDRGLKYEDDKHFGGCLLKRAPANSRIVRLLIKNGFPFTKDMLCDRLSSSDLEKDWGKIFSRNGGGIWELEKNWGEIFFNDEKGAWELEQYRGGIFYDYEKEARELEKIRGKILFGDEQEVWPWHLENYWGEVPFNEEREVWEIKRDRSEIFFRCEREGSAWELDAIVSAIVNRKVRYDVDPKFIRLDAKEGKSIASYNNELRGLYL